MSDTFIRMNARTGSLSALDIHDHDREVFLRDAQGHRGPEYS